MDKKKALLLIGEFLIVAAFLAAMFYLFDVKTSFGGVVFGAIFGMAISRGVERLWRKLQIPKTPNAPR